MDLRVEDKTTLMLGGGKLGERKVQSLLDHKALVIVIGKTLTPVLKNLVKKGKISFIEEDLARAERLGVRVQIVPEEPSARPMIAALADYWEERA